MLAQKFKLEVDSIMSVMSIIRICNYVLMAVSYLIVYSLYNRGSRKLYFVPCFLLVFEIIYAAILILLRKDIGTIFVAVFPSSVLALVLFPLGRHLLTKHDRLLEINKILEKPDKWKEKSIWVDKKVTNSELVNIKNMIDCVLTEINNQLAGDTAGTLTIFCSKKNNTVSTKFYNTCRIDNYSNLDDLYGSISKKNHALLSVKRKWASIVIEMIYKI
jgi:hypothetical protein